MIDGTEFFPRLGSVCGVQGETPCRVLSLVVHRRYVRGGICVRVSVLVDVEVTEVVEGRAQRPARLHVVHLLGQLWTRARE